MGWKCQEMQGISIHALREEGDGAIFDDGLPTCKFLSTPSARRATSSGHWSRRVPWHFYPRPPRGGRQRVRASGWGYRGISIHALREEGDGAICCKPWSTRHFYPRPPRGGRRECIVDIDSTTEISIHALREEGDGGNQHGCLDERISIHALREEGDRYTRSSPYGRVKFLSTPSARRATD